MRHKVARKPPDYIPPKGDLAASVSSGRTSCAGHRHAVDARHDGLGVERCLTLTMCVIRSGGVGNRRDAVIAELKLYHFPGGIDGQPATNLTRAHQGMPRRSSLTEITIRASFQKATKEILQDTFADLN
ncbi:hypothetical protein PGT21_012714 [Puccinia graminis f. sp. tritici]|uniref:Uncharacterized protein n=1 Tax=Puccinia graminis f. sp. tritici TaxID=56615 RepID=A0A5B0QFN8_PUCGR|nr:hypothetical protein PGT21_012714 [Puccinia graminis f. sp. tritici]